MDEFGIIQTYFSPLAKGFPGSLNLKDDAALLHAPAGCELVATTDALIAGVHFLGHEDASLIARKALRVNLSDLAAMGARPMAYLLALMLPKNTKPAWLARFAAGLAQDQRLFSLHLAGGDTTATPGPLSLSITAFGSAPKGKALKRSGARPGDSIYVSGTLGDSALGLASLRGKLKSRLSGSDREFLEDRYLLPQPRVALGQKLLETANACMDISDGLVQDLEHICAASGTGADIHAGRLPLSKAAASLPGALSAALCGGDDYELLFTAPPEKPVPGDCTAIGEITKGKGVRVLDAKGKPITLARKGFKHF